MILLSLGRYFLKVMDDFWIRHPAVLYGLCALLSFSYSVEQFPEVLVLLILISATCASDLRRFLLRCCMIWSVSICVMAYASTVYQFPNIPSQGIEGRLHFEIHSISISETHFGRQWIYQGTGRQFQVKNGSEKHNFQAKNFPCSIRIPFKKNLTRPPADRTYMIAGVLKKSELGNYTFSFKNSEPWLPIKDSWSLAEMRYEMKQSVKDFINQRIDISRSGEFLAGIITGQFEDRIMRAEFGKLGLQHLMAISGFHFALLASIVAFFFRIVFPHKMTLGLLILFMSLYFFFLGGSPSIVRAWVMSAVTLTGLLIERRTIALNTLGVSLIFVLLFDPLLIGTIGFQFSAAVTASILIFYPTTKVLLQRLILIRSLATMHKMNWFDQHCYCVLSVLREGLALALAVNIVAVPMTFYYFHKFPLMSLIYNLFIPFLVSCSMFLVLVGSLCHFILPSVGLVLFKITTHFTHFMLNFIYNTPPALNTFWHLEKAPLHLIIIYLTAVFVFGIFFKFILGKDNPVENTLWV